MARGDSVQGLCASPAVWQLQPLASAVSGQKPWWLLPQLAHAWVPHVRPLLTPLLVQVVVKSPYIRRGLILLEPGNLEVLGGQVGGCAPGGGHTLVAGV